MAGGKGDSNKFQERPSGASRMQENLLAAAAVLRTPLMELTAWPHCPQTRRLSVLFN